MQVLKLVGRLRLHERKQTRIGNGKNISSKSLRHCRRHSVSADNNMANQESGSEQAAKSGYRESPFNGRQGYVQKAMECNLVKSNKTENSSVT